MEPSIAVQKPQDESDIRVRRTGIFKLKDVAGRTFQGINLKKQFGFIPEVIIIEKIWGRSNVFQVLAVLTDEEKKLEDERIKNYKAVQPQKHGRQTKKSGVQKKG